MTATFATGSSTAPAASATKIDPSNTNQTPGGLVIGGVTFDDDEVPESLTFGIRQALAKRISIGGLKNVQSLGSVLKDQQWEGKLYDTRASTRVKELLRMADSGSQVLMSLVDIYSWNVIVEDFSPTIYQRYYYGYSISICTVSDQSGMLANSAPTSVDSVVQSMMAQTMANINSFNDDAAVNLQSTAATLNSVVSLSPTLAGGASQNSSVLAALAPALQAAQTYAAVAGTAQATIVANLLALMQRNVQVGQSQQTVTVSGANWAQLAATYYGDASLGVALAQANGATSSLKLSSSTIQTVVIPALTALTGS